MRRLVTTLALLGGAAALLFSLAGCSHKLTGVAMRTEAPHTILFVQGPVDTVNHFVHLYWFGSDANGYISGYEIKLVNPEDPVAADSAWHFTTRTDTILSIYTPAGHARPTFYARAINNEGVKDPTPAVETFLFRNHPPFVTWKVIPTRSSTERSDTSFASVSVSWTVSDPDGDPAKLRFRVWLDGRETTPDIVNTLLYTVPSDRFLVNGVWTSGPRTLSVQAIDDGGMAGNIITTTWFVKAPVANPNYTPGHRPGRLLIIDDFPRAYSTNTAVDTIYTNTAARNLPAGTWSVMQTDAFQPFKTWQDLDQTMKLYDSVIWYRGIQDTVASLIQNFEPALGSYLDSGGNLYLEGLFLIQGVNAEGALSQSFLRNYLGSDGLRSAYRSSSFDSTQGWGTQNGSKFTTTMYNDTLTQSLLPGSRFGGGGGVRVFNVRNNSYIAMLGTRDTKPAGGTPGLTPMAGDSLAGPPLPVAVSVPQSAGGRAVVFTLPIAFSTPLARSHFALVLARVFAQLGLTGP
jgi:hypothetical protein